MDPIELEPSPGITPSADLRARMDELPPVRLISVDDVRLITPPNLSAKLDALYVDLLEFTRDAQSQELIYRAENFRLKLEVVDQIPTPRDGVRPIGIEVRSLRDAERKLFEHQIEYIRQRGLLPGLITLLLQDPAGNWIELSEATRLG
jgi:hypothetical protein